MPKYIPVRTPYTKKLKSVGKKSKGFGKELLQELLFNCDSVEDARIACKLLNKLNKKKK